jgi:hypothetical protein
MALKIVKRAQVNENFLGLMLHIYQRWMQAEGRIAETYPGGKKNYFAQNRMRHVRINNLLHGGDGDGRSGKTYEITKLRALHYTDFKAIRHGDVNYLVGETIPIIIDHVEKNHRGVPDRVYHLGPYRVYIAESVVLDGRLDQVHMIPLKCPGTINRSPHHRAAINDEHHPLSYTTSTCWGDFGTAIKSYAADADIPELFRGLFLYLSRYNPNSPLIDIHRMDWDVETPWEQFNAH